MTHMLEATIDAFYHIIITVHANIVIEVIYGRKLCFICLAILIKIIIKVHR